VNFLYALDLVGTFVFALSGVLTASEKKFDVFGAAVIAFVTAIGGGTLRDMLIGDTPVGWMRDMNVLGVIGLAVVLGVLFRRGIIRLRNTLFLFDSVGIGVFTVLGVQKALSFHLGGVVAVMMGTLSAVFVGVIRDILTNETPLIFRREIYATPCILGGSLYFLLMHLARPNLWLALGPALLITGVRLLAVKRHWALPRVH